MQIGHNFKVIYSNFVLESIFTTINQSIQKQMDELVVRNVNLNQKDSAGYSIDGHQFIHSALKNSMNLSSRQLNKTELGIVHPDLVDESLILIQFIQSQDIDKMRFKALINGLLSRVKVLADFDVIFEDIFSPITAEFNSKYSMNLCQNAPSKTSTLTSTDSKEIEVIKERFQTQLNRYKFLTEILGF